MKIRKLKFENHEILKNLSLDFTDKLGNSFDTIIIAGENGTGKSTILKIIYEFIQNGSYELKEEEKITFEIELTSSEIETISKKRPSIPNINSTLELKYDSVSKSGKIYSLEGVEYHNFYGYMLADSILKGAFSDVDINFNNSNIQSIGSKMLDEEKSFKVKSSQNIATEIMQLLIDLEAQDSSDVIKWIDKNPDTVVPEEIKKVRIKRFLKAFEKIFENKKYLGIETLKGSKQVFFEENGKRIALSNFSSGEKQIVFRGGFLLRNKNNFDFGIVLIDEPEISLHPEWQKKIGEYYKEIFFNSKGEQIAQIFMVTHSPFILHNENRKNDKVIILKKNFEGEIQSNGEIFYSCNHEELVKEAFNINLSKNAIDMTKGGHLIITEGKTDWKHYKAAFKNFKEKGYFKDLELYFSEYDYDMGEKNLDNLIREISKIENTKKIICIFDSDTSIGTKYKSNDACKYKDLKNSVYAICIENPEHRKGHVGISVEHLYKDEDLIKIDAEGRRIFLSSEFNQHGRLKKDAGIVFGYKKSIEKNLEIINNKVIDSEVTDMDGQTIALSKENFASYILNKNENFEDIDFSGFLPLLEIIETIVKK